MRSMMMTMMMTMTMMIMIVGASYGIQNLY